MILKGISVNQDPPTKDYLWITPKGNTRFWNQSTWMSIGGSGGSLPVIESSGKYLVTTGTQGNFSLAWSDIDLSNYISGTIGYAAIFNGNNSITNAVDRIRIGDGIIEWDSTNGGFKIYNANSTFENQIVAGIYAGWVSALGANSSGGGGGGDLDWSALIYWDEDPEHIININYLPISLSNGVITIGNNSITPLTSHQDISGKADKTITITGTNGLSGGGTLEQSRTIGMDSTYKEKLDDVLSMFELDSNGDIKTKDKPNNGGHRGFYSESFISALGANSSGGGGGGGGISETDLWRELTNNSGWLSTDPKIIARDHIPINGASGNSGGQTFFAPINGGNVGQFLISNDNSAPSWHTLAASDIPNLSASKITSGTFDTARIPTLSITDKTSGTLPINRGGTGNTTGTATYATTTADTSNTLYPIGVTSSATTTLKRDTSITMAGGALTGITSITTTGDNGFLSYKPSSWTGVSSSQWGVGTIDIQGVIRSSNTDLLHSRNGTNSVILDASNYNSYSPTLTGTGASGTWGINISGNAATATTASKLSTVSQGSLTNPVYFTSGGIPAPCTYSLSSTVNAGTANYLAYYSGANAISSTANLVVNGNTIDLPQINNVALNFRPNDVYYSGWIAYETGGNEAMVFGLKNSNTSFIFANSTSEANVSSSQWQSLTPALQIKQNCVYINSLIGQNVVPSYNLYVNGTSYLNGIAEIPNLLYVNDYIRLGQGGNVIDGYRKSTSAFTNLHLNYYSNGDTTLSYGGGNVGIGTTSPAYKLDVSGKIKATNTILAFRYGSANNLPAITMDKPGSYYVGIGADGTSNRIKFGPCFNMDGDAWVAQNTFNSNEWFFQGYIHATNGIDSESYVTALATNSSDKRLKKNIKKFEAKEIIDKLQPVEFEWNKKANKYNSNLELNKKNYGLIAQDSDGIIDDFVFYLPDGKGYKGVRYEKLIPILLQAVKEQQSEINELKQIIKKLKV